VSAVAPGAGHAGDALPDVVSLDGELVPPREALVSAFDRGLLYGESLFETLKVVDGAPCLWQPHVERLTSACGELGLPLDAAVLEQGVRRLLRARPVAQGALRIQVTGGEQPGGGRGLTAPRAGRHPRVIASVAAVSPQPALVFERGVDVVTVTDLYRPLPWLKSGSYLASVAAKMRAENAGAFECLLVSGEPVRLLEGSFTNVLVWDGVRLVSAPALSRLVGVTETVVVQAARTMGMLTEERPVALDELWAGETRGLVFTGSLLGVCACATLDGRRMAPTGAIANTLRRGLHERESTSRVEWERGREHGS
jgi:branched-subunit amino acid aminotransferase/4-amino-4-deoxychorismate lyase